MATIDEVLGKAKDVADAARKKASEIVRKTQIRMEINSLEKEIAATFEGIGRLVYDADKSGEDIAELKEDLYKTIEALRKKIDALRDELCEYNGAIRCKACGAINANDSVFCSKCGEKL